MESTLRRFTYRDKLEIILSPMVNELRQTLRFISFSSVLTNYQMRFYLADDRTSVPDGHWAKWRYIWALAASPEIQREAKIEQLSEADVLERLDSQVEEIFNVYTSASFREKGRFPGSREEYLMRLGVAVQTRETADLAFPEQIDRFLKLTLSPLDEKYFLPRFGLGFEGVFAWVEALTRKIQDRLDNVGEDLASLRPYFNNIAGRDVNRLRALADRNARKAERIPIFSAQELASGLPSEAAERLVSLLTLDIRDLASYRFPHQRNPLDSVLFLPRGNGTHWMLDPARATRALGQAMVNAFSKEEPLNALYLANRDRALEKAVADCFASVFGEDHVYRNYFLARGQFEKDVLVIWENTAIAVECKASRIRLPSGLPSDLFNFEDDFAKSVQYAYKQAKEVSGILLSSEQYTFLDKSGKPLLRVEAHAITRVFIVCVANVPRGPLGTDMSLTLEVSQQENYPLALRYYDLDTITKYIKTPSELLKYLEARQRLQGVVTTGDELNFAGYFYKFGNLDLGKNSFLDDSFSAAFDEEWYRGEGRSFVSNFDEAPASMVMKREGKEVVMKSVASGKTLSRQKLPTWALRRDARFANVSRNGPCPCGSGDKFKRCCGRRPVVNH